MPEVASTTSSVETPIPKENTIPVEQPEVVDATPRSSFQPIFQRSPATSVGPSTTEHNVAEASPPSSPFVGGFPHKKPMEVLKRLQLKCQQSSGRYPSKTVPVKLSLEVAESLKQIRALLAGQDFLDKCTESPDMAWDALLRLRSLPLNRIHASVARVVIEFEAFFARFTRDLMESQSKRAQRTQLYSQIEAEWDSSVLREQKASQLYTQIQDHNEQMATLDQQRSSYLSQIEELQRKVAEIDEEKMRLNAVEGLPQLETADQEAQAGIVHARKALGLQKNVSLLDQVIFQLDARLVYERELFVELLSKFTV